MGKNKFCKIPIKIIKLYGKSFPFDIYLKLGNDKAVKLSNKNEDISSIFQRYEKKGIEGVYVIREEFEIFISEIRNKVTKKIYSPETLDFEKISIIADTYKVAKEGFKRLGVKPATIDLAKTTNETAIKAIECTPNVYNLLKEFKKNCPEELYFIMLTNYVINGMVDTFTWSSKPLKEKLTLGSLLCDVLLEKESFKEIKEKVAQPDQLSINARNHPRETYERFMTAEEDLGKETLEVIKYHHESPCGKGFPYGIPGRNVSLYPAIRIVAEDFVELLIAENFDHQQKEKILNHLQSKYHVANFKKAYISLKDMLGSNY